MPPIIRRAPLSERIKAYLNPYDLLLWIAEELHESALDEALRDWGMPVGIATNLVFACARFALKKNPNDDIFGEFESKSGWFYWIVSSCSASLLHASTDLVVVPSLTALCQSRYRSSRISSLLPRCSMPSTPSRARASTASSNLPSTKRHPHLLPAECASTHHPPPRR